jgi:hypothetical protein
MAEKEQRSPTGHMTPSQRKASYARYHGTAVQKKRRALRNAARAQAIKDGRAKKGDGKDIDHKQMLAKGGSNDKSNTRVASQAKNRGHGQSPGGTKPGTRIKRGTA